MCPSTGLWPFTGAVKMNNANNKKYIDDKTLKKLIEAAIFIADNPVSVKSLKHSKHKKKFKI